MGMALVATSFPGAIPPTTVIDSNPKLLTSISAYFGKQPDRSRALKKLISPSSG